MRLLLNSTLALAGCTQALAQGDAASGCQTIAEAPARLACYDIVFPPKPSSSANLPPTSAATRVAPAAASVINEQFGLPQKPKGAEAQAIESTVGADFYGWGPNDKIRLQNGQVWEVVDGSSGTTTPDMRKVKVKRGALGSFFLEFEGLTKSPRVRRIQ